MNSHIIVFLQFKVFVFVKCAHVKLKSDFIIHNVLENPRISREFVKTSELRLSANSPNVPLY